MKKKVLLIGLTAVLLSACGGNGEPPAPVTPQYLITFNDENGNLLESKKWDENAIPSYNYQKSDTAEWDYTFKGWSDSLKGNVVTIPAATKDATYYAIVDAVKQKYTITFYDENGSQLDQSEYEYGETPSFSYTKDDTAEWDYTVQGWSTSKGGTKLPSLPAVIGNASYYAVVDAVKQKYNISFYDETGAKLGDSLTEYGVVPTYSYAKQDTAEWDYTVEGWSSTLGGAKLSSLPAVIGAASYYAVVTKVKQQYTITFNSNGGSSVNSITQEYGSSVSEPTEPTKDGYSFVCWCSDSSLNNAVTWPYEIKSNQTFYAKWNEKVDIKGYLTALVGALGQDPYSYIPDTMKPTNSNNYVTASQVNYDFSSFTNVSDVKYGGFGEQWQMVIDNIQESEKFYVVFTLADNVISASVAAFNNWFDNNPSSTNKEINETGYYAKVDFSSGVLSYTIQLKTGITIPFFGEVIPQIDMTYNISSKEKSVRVNLTDTNAMRYVVTDDKYVFGIEYGVDALNRSAYCQLNKVDDAYEGHIYEYITLKDKDAVKSCADFYIGETYTSVVGNKASGIVGMDGYINELYKTSEGKLLGYKVQETKDFPVIGTSTYHTLWFNLNNISGINSVKAIPNGNVDVAAKNTHDVYVNGSTKIFEPTYNKVTLVKTSRKYDIEMRTQFRYGLTSGELTCYKTQIPMMFIQDDHDGYTNYSDFESDILAENGVSASVNLSSSYLTKIRNDYDALIPLFKENKELVNSETIQNWIGTVVK